MLTVTAAFTKTVGVPATGLTLAEIDFYLVAIAKATGAQTVVWNGTQHPTDEVASLGVYLRQYDDADLTLYDYVAGANYTGVEVLDSDWITGSASSGATPAEIRAEMDANSVRLAAIQLVTDAIDVSEITLAPVNVLGHLTITAALTFETSITGIVTPQDWTSAVWTLKRTRRDPDTASIIKLVESNPGVGTDGVTVLNGAAPVSPLTAAAGALTIDTGAGTAGIRLTDDLTAELATRSGLIWGLKFLRSNGDSKEYAGTADIDLSVVHGV